MSPQQVEFLDFPRLDKFGPRAIIQPRLNYYVRILNMPDEFSTKTDLQTLLEWLKVIGEPKRLQILELIIQGVQCNCELSEALQVGPTLISHHMKALTQIGLVDVERDAFDARWVYYSINLQALNKLKQVFGDFFDPVRIQPRRLTCGPSAQLINIEEKESVES